jgi:hypothetical protein
MPEAKKKEWMREKLEAMAQLPLTNNGLNNRLNMHHALRFRQDSTVYLKTEGALTLVAQGLDNPWGIFPCPTTMPTTTFL